MLSRAVTPAEVMAAARWPGAFSCGAGSTDPGGGRGCRGEWKGGWGRWREQGARTAGTRGSGWGGEGEAKKSGGRKAGGGR